MSTITKKDLVDRITESTQTKRVLVKATVQNFFDEVISELTKGNRFQGSVFEIVRKVDAVNRIDSKAAPGKPETTAPTPPIFSCFSA
ncbi:MAG TPA: HU family DNA-binding protein [Sedimentisphaerales bacterium]|nr:HU family DNA-binding protein [Sedimentisphaerales bacterium]